MIPKPFNDISWQDILDLIGQREEDQTIEFKSSFKGGSDFLSLSEPKQKAALESITREVIAFLNAQGGDVIIGLNEAENAHPVASEIVTVANAQAIVDRLSQAIGARIEPFQSVVQVRAVTSQGGENGIIVVRAPSSLRAPHRSRETRECYIRRGREAVPVPMDEIQDLTLSRSHLRSERFSLLDKQFSVLSADRLGSNFLPEDRVHLRLAYAPLARSQIELSQSTLTEFSGRDPKLYEGSREFSNGQWKPIVRGRRSTHVNAYDGKMSLSSKELSESGIMATDFADNYRLEKSGKEYLGAYLAWVVGFLANSIASIQGVVEANPTLGDGILRLGARIPAAAKLIVGESHWSQVFELPQGVTLFPDMEIRAGGNFDEVFKQTQIDFCAAAGLDWTPASFICSE